MSKQALLVAGDAIADASVDALLATAHALVRAATRKVRVGTAELSRDELIDQVVVCQQMQNTAWAAQSVRLAQVAAIEEVLSPTGEQPREVRHAIGTYADEWLPEEIGARLGWSDRQTANRLGDAVDAIRCTPRMFGLVSAGVLDPRKLSVVTETVCGMSPKVARKIEAALLAAIDDARAASEGDEGGNEPVPLTSTKLVRRTRRLLADLAPADADRAAQQSRDNAKGVRVFPHDEPGLSVLRAVLPTDDAVRLMAGVNELARQLQQETTTAKSLEESRVDAFIDLLLGNISVSTTCVVQIPLRPMNSDRADAADDAVDEYAARPVWSSSVEAKLEQLLRLSAGEAFDELLRWDTPTATFVERRPCAVGSGSDPKSGRRCEPGMEIELGAARSGCQQRSGPGNGHLPTGREGERPSAGAPPVRYRVGDVLVEGIGVIPAAVLAELCKTLGTTLTRALVDTETGATVETSDITYRPGARLRRFVVTRDQHCRFPGCTRPARLDDLDHIVRWPEGDTAASNLQCLCRHHHRAKHEGGWQVSMTSDGVCAWTSPSGRRYLTRPAD